MTHKTIGRWSTGSWLLAAWSLLSACSGSVSPPADDDSTPKGGVTSAGGSSSVLGGGSTGSNAGGTTSGASAGNTAASAGAGALAGATSAAAVCPSTTVTHTPLRRLTRFEYGNTVKYLLNVDPSPANDLPPDEVTDGFDNNAGVLTVSSLHADKYVLVSEALAKAAVKNLATLTNCDVASQGEDACALQFAKSFGRRAFRRPTSDLDQQNLLAAYAAGRSDGSYSEGIEVMIRAALQSPDFLYRLETTTPDATAGMVPLSQFELATRLAYLTWSAGPDDALLDAAERGELGTKEQIAAKARAMLNDPKARVALSNFYAQWMGTNRLDIITKSTALFPAYSSDVHDGMAREMPAFVQYVLWSGDHKLSTLLLSPAAFVTPALASIYGVNAPAGATASNPGLVMLPDAQGRAGILTQAGFLTVQAHPDQTSPVLRGKFIRSKLLCQPPPPPPADVDISPPEVEQGGTARERFSAHLQAGSSCNGCHQLMDPIGLAFENFDAVGQYRTLDNGKAVDASGQIVAASDPSLGGNFTGVRELATKLAGSEQVRDCLATQWFRFSAGRDEGELDACSLATLQDTFSSSGGDLVELIVGATQTDAFRYRAPTAQ